MADIFVSYSKKDHDQARLLTAALEAEGYSVWWDTSLLSGEQFRKTIMTELGRARAVIVIWTESSIHSDWVLSEAGRGHAERKLIPVKERNLSYKDIPPPFDNMHIENLDDREKVIAAVVAQLAKPEVKVSSLRQGIARTRLELLSWVGVFGAVITLTTNLKGEITLADGLHYFLTQWEKYVHNFWATVLFFLPEVSRGDAIALTFGMFLSTTFLASVKRQVPPRRSWWTRAAIAIAAAFGLVACAFLLVFQENVMVSSQYAIWFNQVFFYLEEKGIHIASWIKKAMNFIMDFINDEEFPLVVRFSVLLVVLPLSAALIFSPLLLVFGAVSVAGRLMGFRPRLSTFASRLWRVLVGVALLVAFNYVYIRTPDWLASFKDAIK